MKRSIFIILPSVICIIALTSFVKSEKMVKLHNYSFDRGEEISYRVHYGFINAGESKVTVSDRHYILNDKICYRVEVSGNTVGAFDKILRIRNIWGSYFDTSYFQPQKSFRHIQEGRYRKREETFYDYNKRVAKVIAENDTAKLVKVSPDIQDMVSGYYYLRLLNYDSMKEGDTLHLKGIFEDQTYNFKILYMGRHVVETKFGKIPSILLKPVMPDNKLFSGTNPISFYISEDKNRIPIKVKASLVVGSVELDIKDYKNLRHPLAVLKKK
jgi:hypothetical protein